MILRPPLSRQRLITAPDYMRSPYPVLVNILSALLGKYHMRSRRSKSDVGKSTGRRDIRTDTYIVHIEKAAVGAERG